MQIQGLKDRRQRELYPTAKGRDLALALATPQSRRIAEALENYGPAEREAIEGFLRGMVKPELLTQVVLTPGARGALPNRSLPPRHIPTFVAA